MTDLIERLRPYVLRKDFREFVRRGVRDWCDWHSEQTEKISELRLVPDGESEEATERRFPEIDALEGNPNYRLVAWADDDRLTISSKCALVALYWYRQNEKSRTLCPTPQAPNYDVPEEVPEAPTEPFELLLHMGDGREPSRFDAIDIITQDVLAAFERQHPGIGEPTSGGLSNKSAEKQESVSAAEANAEMMKLIKANPAMAECTKAQFAEAVATKTGKKCSPTTVFNTTMWKQLQQQENGRGAVKRPATLEKGAIEAVAEANKLVHRMADSEISKQQAEEYIESSKLPKDQRNDLLDQLELGQIDPETALEIAQLAEQTVAEERADGARHRHHRASS